MERREDYKQAEEEREKGILENEKKKEQIIKEPGDFLKRQLKLPNPVEPRNIDNFLNPPTDEEILNAANIMNINPEHFQTKPCSVCMMQGWRYKDNEATRYIGNWNFTKFHFIIWRLKIYRLYKVIMFSMHAQIVLEI
jgi:hypothetical protein